jgi:hypothetical protein
MAKSKSKDKPPAEEPASVNETMAALQATNEENPPIASRRSRRIAEQENDE